MSRTELVGGRYDGLRPFEASPPPAMFALVILVDREGDSKGPYPVAGVQGRMPWLGYCLPSQIPAEPPARQHEVYWRTGPDRFQVTRGWPPVPIA